MKIVISTVSRQPQYVYGTLNSMIANDDSVKVGDLMFCVGQHDTTYLNGLANVLPLTKEEWAANCAKTSFERITFNLLRSLQLAADANGDNLCVIAEDDGIFAPEWCKRITRMYAALYGRMKNYNFMLTAYTPYGPAAFRPFLKIKSHLPRRPGWADDSDVAHLHKRQQDFYGNVCICMNGAIARRIVAWARTPNGGRHIGDQLIKNFFLEHKMPIFAMIPSPVDHVGLQSSHLDNAPKRVAFRFA